MQEPAAELVMLQFVVVGHTARLKKKESVNGKCGARYASREYIHLDFFDGQCEIVVRQDLLWQHSEELIADWQLEVA
jgi:hypothetical protein